MLYKAHKKFWEEREREVESRRVDKSEKSREK
jgi:hypothetical protein